MSDMTDAFILVADNDEGLYTEIMELKGGAESATELSERIRDYMLDAIREMDGSVSSSVYAMGLLLRELLAYEDWDAIGEHFWED